MRFLLSIILCLCLFISGCSINSTSLNKNQQQHNNLNENLIPEYTGKPYTIINNNIPYFSDSDLTTKSFEKYSDLDYLGRVGVAYANIGKDIMPTKKRENISHIKPTGWHKTNYDIVEGNSLYNRSHLIGFQLSAENANEKNLMTGTRYLNTEGMLPFENKVSEYVKRTNNHVLYRVTPIFEGNNLIASGVFMEAKSVEDNGKSISFNVFIHNVQPGIKINYKTGDSYLDEDFSNSDYSKYVLNTHSKVFHRNTCSSVLKIKDSNKKPTNKNKQYLISNGYSPCKICKP